MLSSMQASNHNILIVFSLISRLNRLNINQPVTLKNIKN
jgi:hypothetical protein